MRGSNPWPGPAGKAGFRRSAHWRRPTSHASDRNNLEATRCVTLPGCLDIALDQNERAPHLLAEVFHHLRPHHDLAMRFRFFFLFPLLFFFFFFFFFLSHEQDALALPGSMQHQHHAGAAHTLFVIGRQTHSQGMTQIGVPKTIGPQKFPRMALQRQAGMV